MDIKSYLLELIATRKKISITTLGTLYKKKIPGRYDSETHSFLPPKHEIAFTSEQSNDQELVNFISERENISTESANYHINEFVGHIQTQLNAHQQADFSPLGQLKLVNDQIFLESDHTLDIGFEFYGLPTVEATVAQQEEIAEAHEPSVEEDPVYDEIAEVNVQDIAEPNTTKQQKEAPVQIETAEVSAEDTESDLTAQPEEQPASDEANAVSTIQDLNENEERVDIEAPRPITDPLWKPTVITPYEIEDDEEDENIGKGKRIFLKAGLILLLIVVAIGVTFLFFPDHFDAVKNKFIPETDQLIEPVDMDTTAAQPIDSAVHDSINRNVAAPSSVIKDTLTSSATIYEVIGSAMRTHKKADEVIAILQRRGINAKKVEAMPGNHIKISLGTFTDLKLAKKHQDSLKIKLKNPEIYIQTIKPKN